MSSVLVEMLTQRTPLQDNITLDNFDEILMNLSGAVRGAAMNEEEQTTSNLAMVTAAFARSAQLTNEMTVIQNAVSSLLFYFNSLIDSIL